MSPDIMTVPDDMRLDDVARYLTEHEISGTPVVDEQGHLVGMVSMTDITRNAAELADRGSMLGGRWTQEGPSFEAQTESDGEPVTTARDVMTPAVHHVPATASVAEVARRMVDEHVHRLVVTEGKEPVGIVTSMDLLKLLAG